MALDISFSDYIQIQNLACSWADCYDTKDWRRLRSLLAPSSRLDLRTFGVGSYEGLTPRGFTDIVSNGRVLGDEKVKTQHLLGASRWEVCPDGGDSGDGGVVVVHVVWQIRVGHQRYAAMADDPHDDNGPHGKNDDLRRIENKGHGHGTVQHWYRKVDGKWLIEGVAPELRWTEYDLIGTVTGSKLLSGLLRWLPKSAVPGWLL